MSSAAQRFNPASENMAGERYPLLAAMRSENPVTFIPAIGMWAVTGCDALREVLSDAERFPSGLGYRAPDHLPREAFAIYPANAPIWKYALIGTDSDLHRRLRTPIQAALTRRRVEAAEPLIADDAQHLLGLLFNEGEPADLYAKVLRPLPSRTIARFFGLPVEDGAKFAEWSSAFIMLQVPNLPVDAHVFAASQFAAFDAYVREIVMGDLKGIGDGIIRTLVEGGRAGEHDLTEDEMVGNIANMLFAGHETTVSTLSNIFARLLQNPDLWNALVTGSLDFTAMIDELLRLDTSVIGLFRYAAAETTIAGVTIPAGSAIWAAFGATNRDPKHFVRPDDFEVGRDPDAVPLTFGHGAHYCVGRALAETQIRIALKTIPSAFPTMKLVGPLFEVPNYLLRITPVIMVSP